MAKGTLNVGADQMQITEQADVQADTAAQGQLWVNTASVPELYFTGDTGTDIQITTATAVAGAFDTDAAQTFNDSGADVDFRVESNNDANMLFVDGGTDRVGIGTNAPGASLDVVGEVVMRKNAIRNPRFQAWVMGG